MKKKVVVGMSGGVDSSVAAYLLQQQGYEVLGVFMINWEDATDNPSYRDEVLSGCTWEKDFEDVRRVCDQLGIQYTTFNFVQEYHDLVFNTFLEELKAGRTPNPDILCNQEIKFHLFLKKALAIPGVEAVATGHYAKITHHKGEARLCRPVDSNKDQTYFLHRMNPASLDKVLFPLADYTKDQIRAIAQEQQFPNADKKDSTGICFIGDINYSEFVRQYIPESTGTIVTTTGEIIGNHTGLHLFTRGQRKGIDIGGTGPYYVVDKDFEHNALIVTNNPNDTLLYHASCTVSNMHWLYTISLPAQVSVQVRYRQEAIPARIDMDEQNNVHVQFDEPQRAVTPGQSAVFYDGDCVIGGGIINETHA